MKILTSLSLLSSALCGEPFLATMGFFDGVHLGHQALLNELREDALRKGMKSVILALDRPYAVAARPDLPHPKLLSSLSKKVSLLSEQPCDLLFLIPFTNEVAALDMEAFVRPLMEIGMKGMTLGYDNRFGRKEYALPLTDFDERLRNLGLDVRRIRQYRADGIPVSSSEIRERVQGGDFEGARLLLGRPFSLIGEVESGRKIGRTIDYPTANIVPIEPDIVLPRPGIFVSEVRVEDQVYPSMSYYGSSPTVAGWQGPLRIEAYLFGFHDNLYGKRAEIAFRHRIRGDRQFDSLKELKERLAQDEQFTKEYFRNHPLLLA